MHKKLAEAALFMATRPLGLDELGKIMGMNSLGFVKQVVEELQREYEGRGMEIVNTPDGWVMQAKQQLLPKIAHLTPYHDLSEGTKKTLALVVYKEPLKQSDIIKTQGNKAYSYIKDLVKKGLIKTEKDGRTKILHLTPEFERYFGEERNAVRQKMDLQVQTQQKLSQFAQQGPMEAAEAAQQIPQQIEQQVQEGMQELERVVQEDVKKLPRMVVKEITPSDEPEKIQAPKEPSMKESKKVAEIKKQQDKAVAKPVKETGEIVFENLKKKKSSGENI
jgi:segregation and condensation protein B